MVASVADRLAARATQTFTNAPWQRADACLPPVYDSPTRLNPSVQRILRYGLMLILASRLEARRACERAGEPIPFLLGPHSLEGVERPRFYPQAAWAFSVAEARRALRRELEMTIWGLELPPRPRPDQSWQSWHQAFERWEAIVAQQELAWGLDDLLPEGARPSSRL